MSKLYKTGHKSFTAWNYKAEIEELNKMSEQGWQLMKGKLFSQKYKKNENVVYRYQIDYQPHVEDLSRYIDTFREQGWEYVNSTINGWHYFKKIYDPSLPEESYEIYSDESSLKDMNNRWVRLGTLFAFLLGLDAVMLGVLLARNFSITRTILCVAIIAEFFWLLFGTIKMKKNRQNNKSFNARIFLAVLFGSFLIYFLLSGARVDFSANTNAENYNKITKEQSVNWTVQKVSLPEFYSLEMKGNLSSPLSYELRNTKNNEVIFEDTVFPETDGNVSYKKKNFFLKSGTYSINFTSFEGGKMDLKIDWD